MKECGVNQRPFELAAIGVPQVVDYRGDLERHFTDRKEVLVYRSRGGDARAGRGGAPGPRGG